MKILNSYAGIGGNRKLWTPNGNEHEITAVELNPDIAKVYQGFYPNDTVIVGDAHQYLLEHYKEFDFIWASPPCPTHSCTNNFLNAQGVIRYPDMKLYEEIIFVKHFFKGLFLIENVKSYYNPLIEPIVLDRHYFWSNFHIQNYKVKRNFNICNASKETRLKQKRYMQELSDFLGINIDKYKIKDKNKIMRNCVVPSLGKHILDCAMGAEIKIEELSLF